MSLFNSFETSLLQLLFNNTALANIGDASGLQPSAAAGSLYLALHTADPGEAGNGTTSEATYTGYARLAVARSAGGFTVSGNTVTNAALAQFAACTAGSNTITHASICATASGTTTPIVSGALSASLAVSAGIQPKFDIGTLSMTLD